MNVSDPIGEMEALLASIDPAELVDLLVDFLRWVAHTTGIPDEDVEAYIAAQLSFLRRRVTGDFEVDDFGFDRDFVEHVMIPMLRPLYEKWFRVEVIGGENIPAEGPALIVMNHSGTLPLDVMMVQLAVHGAHPGNPRYARALGADLLFGTPVLGDLARKGGATVATAPDASRLLAAGEVVAVCPEGFKGVGKPFSERYRLQRFGRGGFVSTALAAHAPIIPCSVVGAEETYPNLGNLPVLARLLGLPYFPVTPTFPLLGPLGMIPLPSRWIIDFGAPMPTDTLGQDAADDPMLVFDLTDRVRETIQRRLYSLLAQRGSTFF